MLPAENLTGEDQESPAQSSRHEREGQDEIMEAENLQISISLASSGVLQPGEQVLSDLGDQSELDRGGGE